MPVDGAVPGDGGAAPSGPLAPAAGPLRYPAPLPLPLAYGDLAAEDADELQALKELIEAKGGLRSAGYKEKCLRRRIAVRMRARGVHRYADYADLVGRDAEEYQRLLDTITINVSKFYRNPEVWETLRAEVVPALFALRDREVRIWSAGAAGGEEPFSVAILLADYAEEHGLTDRLDRFVIRASDIDRESLRIAERAEYGDFAFGEIPERLRRRWFEGPRASRVAAELRHRVRFESLDLMVGPFPRAQHLILCRNVIIYFERPVQESLFLRFHEALAPGGFLVMGKVETLFGAGARSFEPVANRERIFRRA